MHPMVLSEQIASSGQMGTAVKHWLGNPSPPRPRKGTIMDCEPDRDRQEGAPPASNTSLRPSSSALYRGPRTGHCCAS